ncbi:MAG TPA: glycosyltransferase family 4 protein [Nocardioidaceae bacterium]
MRLRLVVPANVDSPTGGNVYDVSMADALRRQGHGVEVVRCQPSGLSDVLRRPWSGPTLVDGLLACRDPQALASRDIGVLVHMPLAWETGLSSEHAAELDGQEEQALLAARVVVCTSHWCAHHLAHRHGVQHVVVAPPGVDPAPLSTGSDPPLLVQVAALLPHKDQLTVVAALRRLTGLSWRARLVGSVDRDPEYAATVRDAVSSAGLTDRVDMPGEVSRDDAYAGADLALLPSRAEAFGLVVTEALARGVPVVVSETGAAEALGLTHTGRRPGMVVPAGDVDALSDALRRWLTDASFRNDLRSRALERRETLEGWEATAKRIVSALTAT